MLAAFVLVALILAVAAAADVVAKSGPQASTASADPTVGPLFPAGLSAPHNCTATVLSVGSGLLLTAAHCISGTAAGVLFAPGYDGSAADPTPYGVWPVNRVWVSPAWLTAQDPQHDYALLHVDDIQMGGNARSVASVTGGNAVGFAVTAGTPVTVPAYPAGLDDAPISCDAPTFDQDGYPGFRCGGYVGGTSGGPWLSTVPNPGVRTVVGVIGGLHQGGCTDSTSYSSSFHLDMIALLIRAFLDLPGDDLSAAGDDGC